VIKNNQNIVKVLIIIPCYNEESRLKIESFHQFADKNSNLHFLFVDDGSSDLTARIIKDLCKKTKNADYLILNKNVGKGEAIRRGVLAYESKLNDWEFIGYLDADLSVPLEEINNSLSTLQENENISFLLGARISRLGAHINRTARRHYIGRVFATLVSLILKEPVYDSQCGFKLIKSTMAIELFKDEFISKWLFDVELLFRWKIIFPNYIDSLYEQPLMNWTEVSGSKLKFKDFLSAPFGLFTIWNSYRKSLRNAELSKSNRKVV